MTVTPPASGDRTADDTVAERIEALIGQMTLGEKLAQLGSAFAFDVLDGEEVSHERLRAVADHGIGQITRVAGATSMSREQIAAVTNDIQRFLRDETRLGIPAVIHEECLAGYMAADAEIFPQPLGLAASWSPRLARRVGDAIARQMRHAGANLGLSPVLDVARDPRWGRVEETFGEDPHLVSALGLAMVQGLQGRDGDLGVLATAKHFVGHGAPEGGRNAATPHIPPRELREVYMAPFEQAVRHGAVAAVMHAYHDLDGVPCIASAELLDGVLRGEWGFDGVVVSDYNGVEELHEAHRLAPDLEHAAVLALDAGLDVELPETSGFGAPLASAVRRGTVLVELVDRSVRRVLRGKFALGLFDDPFVDEGQVHDADADVAVIAREAADESLVLLQNRNQVLPLRDCSRLAVIGPHSADGRGMVGDYAHVAHQTLLEELRHRRLAGSPPIPDHLVLKTELVGVDGIGPALADALSDVDVVIHEGCGIRDDDRSGIASAVELARTVDVVVLAVGELSGLTEECTAGESRDRSELGLPGVQQELLEAVVATGTPVVLVLLSGRPNSISWAAKHVDAVLWAILPGRYGGEAIARVITGRHEPVGRLPITVPRHVGQVPVHYLHNPSSSRSRWRDDYVEVSHTPLWAFGHGLGFADVEVARATASATRIATSEETIELDVELVNASDRATTTTLQVYLEQPSASVVRPARRLVAFDRVEVGACATVTHRMAVPVGRFALVDRAYRRVVEPGTVDLAVGLASDNLAHRVTIEIEGEPLAVDLPPPAS